MGWAKQLKLFRWEMQDWIYTQWPNFYDNMTLIQKSVTTGQEANLSAGTSAAIGPGKSWLSQWPTTFLYFALASNSEPRESQICSHPRHIGHPTSS